MNKDTFIITLAHEITLAISSLGTTSVDHEHKAAALIADYIDSAIQKHVGTIHANRDGDTVAFVERFDVLDYGRCYYCHKMASECKCVDTPATGSGIDVTTFDHGLLVSAASLLNGFVEHDAGSDETWVSTARDLVESALTGKPYTLDSAPADGELRMTIDRMRGILAGETKKQHTEQAAEVGNAAVKLYDMLSLVQLLVSKYTQITDVLSETGAVLYEHGLLEQDPEKPEFDEPPMRLRADEQLPMTFQAYIDRIEQLTQKGFILNTPIPEDKLLEY